MGYRPFRITLDLLLNLSGRFEVVANPLPLDAKIAAWDIADGVLVIWVASSGFPSRDQTELPPMTIRRLDDVREVL